MIYLNNRLVKNHEAKISVFDHGFLYGDGIYETLRAYNGVVFMLDEHIRRLQSSAEKIRLSINKSPEEIRSAIYRTLRASNLKNAIIRITVSRGKGRTGLDPDLCPIPTFVIMAQRFHGYPDKYYKEGIKLIIANTRRNHRGAIDPSIKSLNFLNNILAKIEAKDRGAFEAIMLNIKGFLTEGTVSNLFFIKNNILYTPSPASGILEGITRRVIIDLAKEEGLEVREGLYRKDKLYTADEVFISNTSMEIMPVRKVDDQEFRVPGEITRFLHRSFRRYVRGYVQDVSR